MIKLSVSLPDNVAAELTAIAVQAGFTNALAMLSEYIKHEVKDYREAKRDKLIKAANPIDLSDIVIL